MELMGLPSTEWLVPKIVDRFKRCCYLADNFDRKGMTESADQWRFAADQLLACLWDMVGSKDDKWDLIVQDLRQEPGYEL